MATATKGKRKTSKAALRRSAAGSRQRLKSTAREAFPGGAKKTMREVRRMVPPARA